MASVELRDIVTDEDRAAALARVRSRGGDTLYVAYEAGDGSPGPFYERYGFVPTDRFIEGERILRLELAPTAG